MKPLYSSSYSLGVRCCSIATQPLTGLSGYLARQTYLRVCFSNNANGSSATQIGATGTNGNTTKTITISGSPSGRYVRTLRDQTTSVSAAATITLAEIDVQGVTASGTRCLRSGGARCRGDAIAQNEMPNEMMMEDTKREI